jgi:hypothetical protein
MQLEPCIPSSFRGGRGEHTSGSVDSSRSRFTGYPLESHKCIEYIGINKGFDSSSCGGKSCCPKDSIKVELTIVYLNACTIIPKARKLSQLSP